MIKVLFKYYCDVNFFNIIYTVLLSVLFLGFLYVPVIFASVGTLLGIISFRYFYHNEYYFYHNLGFTKRKLNLSVLLLNIFVSIIVTLIYKFLK
jgi:hypothetical protein